MSTKKIYPLQIILVVISMVLTVSCSNKLQVAESIHPIPVKKIAFNSIVLCSNAPSNIGPAGKWYYGTGKANTRIGQLVINCDFGNAIPGQPALRESNLYYSIPLSIDGNRDFSPQLLHITITLDGRNKLFVEYPEAINSNDGDLFGTTATVTGGTGIFMNAKGTINSKIQIERTNHTATAIHSGVIYLE